MRKLDTSISIKFWLINIVAFGIIGVYSWTFINNWIFHDHPVMDKPFYQATSFQFIFMVSVVYLYFEAKLIQKVITARMIKSEGTQKEFQLVSNDVDTYEQGFLKLRGKKHVE